MGAQKGLQRDAVYRLRHAGYSVIDISKKFEVSRQAVYFLLRKMPAVSASISLHEEGIIVKSGDLPATATAIRMALINSGWEVEG